ncbi:MAG TPA: FHA domain-containing protein, partial [Gammaproteobacteria bacterium]|nr:FHA domain-containing protein [Gammaproteobacteria bacterium]
MQLTLRPLSNPELSDIVVSNGYLAIGRRELPFSLYDQQLADTLSRRHARLFEQNDQFHLVDLDSSNGTTVNGREIDDHPVLLKQGDVVTFADHLSYQVDIGGPDKALELDQPTRYIQRNKTPLYLVLESKNPALDTIVIKTFPFLISKDDAVFSRYEKIAPEEVAFLSRKHAYIFQDGEHFFVEELGSTNGTFVNSERLDEKSRQLEGGDILSFGGDYFCYEVHPGGVNPASAPNPGSDKTSTQRVGETFPPEDSEKTTFITSATSFLDIFCQPDEPSAKVVDSPVDEEVAESSDHEYRKTPLGSVFGAPWLWLKKTGDKFRLTLTRGITWLRDWRILSILLAVVVATVFMVTQLFDGEKQRIEQRCAEGAFKDCAVLAGRYLKKQGSPDPYIAGLASKALLKSVVPDWLAKLEKGDFTAADQIMTEAETITAPGTEGAEIVDLLRQIQGVEYYISQRGGPDGAIQMFAHEK